MIDPKNMAQLETLMFGAALLAITVRQNTTGGKPDFTSTAVIKEARALAQAFVAGATKIAADVVPPDTRPGRY